MYALLLSFKQENLLGIKDYIILSQAKLKLICTKLMNHSNKLDLAL